jgi:hypothetical protein
MIAMSQGLFADLRQIRHGVDLANNKLEALAVQMDQMSRELQSEIRMVASSYADLRTRVERLESKATS